MIRIIDAQNQLKLYNNRSFYAVPRYMKHVKKVHGKNMFDIDAFLQEEEDENRVKEEASIFVQYIKYEKSITYTAIAKAVNKTIQHIGRCSQYSLELSITIFNAYPMYLIDFCEFYNIDYGKFVKLIEKCSKT